MFEAEKRHAINLSINETRNVYESKIDLLTKEHESKLQSALAEVVEKSNKKLQKAVVAERVSVTHQMLKKLRDEIGYMVIKLYDEFERKSRVDRENMIADFNKTIRNERNKNNDILNAFEKEKNLEMNIQRLEIENKYINLLINSVRAERSHSETRMSFRQQNFQEKMQALYKLLVKTLYIIKVLNKKLSQPTARIHEPTWRDKLQEIINKFKKIINFVFHAIPGHAEFLLSLESLLSLEHHEDRIACENGDSNRCVLGIIKNFSGSLKNDVFRVVEIVDKNGKKWRPVTLPYQPSVVDEDEPLFIPEIILYHNIDDVLSDNNFFMESNDEIDNDVRTFEELTEEDNFKIQIMDSDINLQNSRESIASDKRKSSVTAPDDLIQHKIRTSLRKSIEIITKLKEEFPSSEPQFSKHEDETDRILLDLMKYSNDLKNV
ncbi:GSCOCG00006226001-RA-CDS [Cotesia congregata]|nr:GSCOCG00006226001-RA-CDS [Cotesia congregata]